MIALMSAFVLPLAVAGWIDLALLVVSVLYLMHPQVRMHFASR